MSDVEVELEEKPEVVVEEVKVEPKIEAKPELKVEDAIAELKARLEEEQNARREAEKRAREFQHQVANAKNEVDETNSVLLNNAISSLKRDSEILKANYKNALASNNYEQAAEIQEQMSQNATKLLRLEEGKTELEKRPKVEVPRMADPVEEFASRLSPQSSQWVKAHPEYVTNPALNRQMLGAHELAMGRGLQADTPQYFDYIENVLGIQQDTPKESSEPVQAPSGGRQTAPSPAPVSRAASTNGASRPNVIRLNEAEREMADMMGMTYQEYAKNKLELQKLGKLN